MMWSAIWSGIKAVAGGGGDKGTSNIEKAASFIGRQYDVSNMTEQERVEFNKAQIDGFRGWFAQTVDENTERSITRRNIALLVIRLNVALTVLAVGAYKFDPEWAVYVFGWFEAWWPLTAGVGVFFFGTHMMRNWQKGKKK